MGCSKKTSGCGVYENRSCDECPYGKPPKTENENKTVINEKIIEFNGEKLKIVKRTDEVNNEFFELLYSAIGKMEEAKGFITYNPKFALNIDIIDRLEKMIDDLEYLCDFAEDRGIFKPVEINEPVHYYELCYFRGRKDTGSIYVKTTLNAKKFINDDAFLNALIENRDLDANIAESISDINQIDKKTYQSFNS